MEYVRCECESCKQMIVLPGEVRVAECRCPACGKPVAIPEHESPALVYRMRARLFATVGLIALLWIVVAVAVSLIGKFRDSPDSPAPPRPHMPSRVPIQASVDHGRPAVSPAGKPEGEKEAVKTPAQTVPGLENATATEQKEPNAG